MTPAININVTDENKFRIVEYLQNNADFGEGKRRVSDGIRMDYSGGWDLCRVSNTSPKPVLRYEAVNQDALARIRDLFEKNAEKATRYAWKCISGLSNRGPAGAFYGLVALEPVAVSGLQICRISKKRK